MLKTPEEVFKSMYEDGSKVFVVSIVWKHIGYDVTQLSTKIVKAENNKEAEQKMIDYLINTCFKEGWNIEEVQSIEVMKIWFL